MLSAHLIKWKCRVPQTCDLKNPTGTALFLRRYPAEACPGRFNMPQVSETSYGGCQLPRTID